MLEYKQVDVEIKEIGQRGEFAGWGAIFETEDHGGDTIRRGAFVESLKRRMPKIYLEHATSVGVLSVAEERDRGLWVEGVPDESRDGLDARAKIRSRALDSLSIGYHTVKSKETGRLKRDLIEVDLYHVGLVPFGMHEDAVITSVKALDLERITTIRELERTLRDAGFTRKAAEMFCSPGYIASLTQGDPDDDLAELAAALTTATKNFRSR